MGARSLRRRLWPKLALVRDVEDELHREFEREVASAEIGRRIAGRLRALDQIAYIRFASEHYEFNSIEDIAEEVNNLKARPRDLPNQVDLFPGS